jgi:hypothetical protein
MHEILPKDLQEIDYDTRAAGPELVLGRSVIRDFANPRVLDRLMLYERRIENSMHKTLKELERRQIIRQFQQQEAEKEFEPSPSLRDEAATREGEKQGDLKKQSQFAPSLIGVTPFVKGFNDKVSTGGDNENKAKQSQFCIPAKVNGTGKKELSPSAATG